MTVFLVYDPKFVLSRRNLVYVRALALFTGTFKDVYADKKFL